MTYRAKFLKGELNNTYNMLNVSFEYVDYASLEEDKRFLKIFELLMEICEKSNILRAHDCKYRESLARIKKSKILVICQKNPFGELPSKKIFSTFKNLYIVFEKMRKNENSGFYLIN